MEKLRPLRTLRNLLIAANLVVGYHLAKAAIVSAIESQEKSAQAFNYDHALFDPNGKVIFENPTPCGQTGKPTCISGKYFTVE